MMTTTNIDYETIYEGKELSGDIFNSLFQGVNFVKLTNEDENHNNFQFQDGLNIDTNEFYPYGSCNRGGIYFVQEKDVYHWLCYKNDPMRYMRKVLVPEDARV